MKAGILVQTMAGKLRAIVGPECKVIITWLRPSRWLIGGHTRISADGLDLRMWDLFSAHSHRSIIIDVTNKCRDSPRLWVLSVLG